MNKFIFVMLTVFFLLISVSFAQSHSGGKNSSPETYHRSANKHWKPMLDASIGLGVQSEAGFKMNIGGMIPIPLVDNLYIRTSIISLWAGNWTTLYFGTGSNADIVYFIPQKKFDPYAFIGLHLNAMSGFTQFTTQFGGGAQLKLKNSPIKPFGEIGLGIISAGGTDISFSMMFGARIEL